MHNWLVSVKTFPFDAPNEYTEEAIQLVGLAAWDVLNQKHSTSTDSAMSAIKKCSDRVNSTPPDCSKLKSVLVYVHDSDKVILRLVTEPKSIRFVMECAHRNFPVKMSGDDTTQFRSVPADWTTPADTRVEMMLCARRPPRAPLGLIIRDRLDFDDLRYAIVKSQHNVEKLAHEFYSGKRCVRLRKDYVHDYDAYTCTHEEYLAVAYSPFHMKFQKE